MRILVLGLAALLSACTPTTGDTVATSESVAAFPDCAPGVHESTVAGLPVRLVVPDGVTTPAPAVMVLHGSDGSGAGIQKQSGMDRAAQDHGFLAVYPSAPGGDWPLNAGGVSRINAVADALTCADSRRIYLAGFSRGSLLTADVACSTQRRRFAAFGGVGLIDYRRNCDRSPVAPWVYLHGTKDSVVSYRRPNILGDGRVTMPPGRAVKRWATHNRCRTGPQVSRIGSNAVLRRWSPCRSRAVIDFYTLVGGDHQWPFRERPNAPLLEYGQSWAGVGANDVMWQFFRSHTLAE